MIVIDAIENGIKQPGKKIDTFEYLTDDIKVVGKQYGSAINMADSKSNIIYGLIHNKDNGEYLKQAQLDFTIPIFDN